jgi:hypothetical protein
MVFDISKFNEIKITGSSLASNTANPVNAEMQTIRITGNKNKRWFGHTAEEFKQLQQDLYGLGSILAANYYVKFESYKKHNLSGLPILADNLTGYLATETNLPLMQANFDQVQFVTMQVNHLTGISEPELQLTLLETADGRISNSLLDWRDLMVNEDGTVNPPASYAGRITIGLFSKDFGLDMRPFERQFLIAPSLASIDSLSGMSVSEGLHIPVTFTVLRNFME